MTLVDLQPAIWRRLIVPWTWRLDQLHLVIQAAFGWHDAHLHEFVIGGLRYGNAEILNEDGFDDMPNAFDERGVRLLDFGREPEAGFLYCYDFGDNWRHTVEFEQLLVLEEPPTRGSCIGGARARPPEDVGSTGGYEDFLEIIGNPADPEHRATKRWCGGHFDPEWFDLALTNKYVGNALKPNVHRRPHQPRPVIKGRGGNRS